jgi:hypothetical protein
MEVAEDGLLVLEAALTDVEVEPVVLPGANIAQQIRPASAFHARNWRSNEKNLAAASGALPQQGAGPG